MFSCRGIALTAESTADINMYNMTAKEYRCTGHMPSSQKRNGR